MTSMETSRICLRATPGATSGAAPAVAVIAIFLLCSFNQQNVLRFPSTRAPPLFVFPARNDCDLAIDPRCCKPLLPQLIPTFFDQIELVDVHIVEHLPLAAGPLDLDGFRPRRFTQSEMGAKITLRKIAPAARNLADLRKAASQNANP